MRRIADLLVSAPFKVRAKPISHFSGPKFNWPVFNANIAEKIIKGTATTIFNDEVIGEISSFGEARKITLDTPKPMPPFRYCWIEGNPYAEDRPDYQIGQLGAFVEYRPMIEEEASSNIIKEKINQSEILNEDKEPVHIVYVDLYLYYAPPLDEVVGPVIRSTYFLNSNFETLITNEPKVEGGKLPLVLNTYLCPPSANITQEGKDLLEDSAFLMLATVMKTFGLLNCSNVHLVDAGYTNDNVSRKRRSREHLAWIKYKELRVKVGKELRSVTMKRGEWGNVPLHLVRGHFKDFSEGKGLFGKYHRANVWVPPHLRGNPETGAVVKDYRLTKGKE